jgi:hypothetical protein
MNMANGYCGGCGRLRGWHITERVARHIAHQIGAKDAK